MMPTNQRTFEYIFFVPERQIKKRIVPCWLGRVIGRNRDDARRMLRIIMDRKVLPAETYIKRAS